MSFSSQAQVDAVLKELKGLFSKYGPSIMNAFHFVDKDNSQQLSTAEFAEALKSINITLPQHTLRALVARFDANGDGSVSIPEFSTFMTGDAQRMDALRSAEAVVDEAPAPSPQRPSAFEKMMAGRASGSVGTYQSMLSETDRQFIARMEGDIETRRRSSFINELKKDPRFKPSMLEPPKPKFQQVDISQSGPIIRSHNSKKTGLETKKPFKWGPLGGYY